MELTLTEAEAQLLIGRVIGIPTDTVYGLAARIDARQAIDTIYNLKWRSRENPLLVLVNDIEDVKNFVDDLPPGFSALAERYWPGALSIVVPTNDAVPKAIRGGLSTTGFRVPNHPVTRDLLRQVGPIVATSANLSGHPAATSREEIEKVFGEDFPVLDGGPCEEGRPSTVVEYTSEGWQVLRHGAVTEEMIQEAVNNGVC